MFDNIFGRQIQDLAQGIVVCEGGLVLGDLTELSIQSLDDIGRIYDFPYLRWICIERGQDIPILLPTFDTGGILLAPGFLKGHEIRESLLLGDGLIHLFQISHQNLDVLPTHIPGTGANLMDDAALNLCLGIRCRDSLSKTIETVHAEQVNILYSAAFQIIQHTGPELGTFVLADPDPQDILPAVGVDA